MPEEKETTTPRCVSRYRASTGGGRKLALECDDFASESAVTPVLGAHLYATTVPKGKGGEDTLPASRDYPR